MKRALALLVLLTACLASTLLAQNKPSTSDDRIYDQVRMKLAGDQDVKGGDLEVTVKDGAVKLTGKVETDRGKKRAETLARKVKGVKSVDNELVVGPKY
ncbi:MAG: BON domain-containing protein [Bryobacteraceae bacterium]